MDGDNIGPLFSSQRKVLMISYVSAGSSSAPQGLKFESLPV